MTSYYIETEIDNSTLGHEVRFATQYEAQRALNGQPSPPHPTPASP